MLVYQYQPWEADNYHLSLLAEKNPFVCISNRHTFHRFQTSWYWQILKPVKSMRLTLKTQKSGLHRASDWTLMLLSALQVRWKTKSESQKVRERQRHLLKLFSLNKTCCLWKLAVCLLVSLCRRRKSNCNLQGGRLKPRQKRQKLQLLQWPHGAPKASRSWQNW